jgi:hypothetical protein
VGKVRVGAFKDKIYPVLRPKPGNNSINFSHNKLKDCIHYLVRYTIFSYSNIFFTIKLYFTFESMVFLQKMVLVGPFSRWVMTWYPAIESNRLPLLILIQNKGLTVDMSGLVLSVPERADGPSLSKDYQPTQSIN